MPFAENAGRKKSPSAHHRTTLSGYIFATKAPIDNPKKKLVKQQYVLQMYPQYGALRPLTAEIGSGVCGTPANFNGFGVLAALLHDSQASAKLCGVEQRASRMFRQVERHVRHWPTF